MLDPEAQITRTSRTLAPRTMVVVDGSAQGWNALSWAVGYARARGIKAVDAVLFTGSWNYVSAVGDAAALMPVHFVPVAQEAATRAIAECAREIGGSLGVNVAVGREDCRSSRELVGLVRREQPDLVVMGHIGSFPRLNARSIASRLIRKGIAVTVIP